MDSGCFKFTYKPVTYMEAVNRCNKEVLTCKLLTVSNDRGIQQFQTGLKITDRIQDGVRCHTINRVPHLV